MKYDPVYKTCCLCDLKWNVSRRENSAYYICPRCERKNRKGGSR